MCVCCLSNFSVNKFNDSKRQERISLQRLFVVFFSLSIRKLQKNEKFTDKLRYTYFTEYEQKLCSTFQNKKVHVTSKESYHKIQNDEFIHLFKFRIYFSHSILCTRIILNCLWCFLFAYIKVT